MKYNKLLLLVLCLTSLTVQAERIDTGDAGDNYIDANPGAPGTLNKVCVKTLFIKRNAGTLVTGLTTTNVKLLKGKATVQSSPSVVTNFNAILSLTASVAPAQPGLYDLCITPSVNTWKATSNYPYYSFQILIKGTVATDNGTFSVDMYI